MFVKPAREGLVVRHARTGQVVPPEGLEIDASDLHWTRIVRDGDLVQAEPKASAKGARKGGPRAGGVVDPTDPPPAAQDADPPPPPPAKND